MLSFLIGSVFLTIGMGLFTLGTESSMTDVGMRVGTTLTGSRKLPLILFVSFLIGIAVTMAEPDLQVLAATVPHINAAVLILTVSVGVGFFLALCMLRILTGICLRALLIVLYGLVFVLAAFSEPSYLGVAFDAGGVTTGPMTVPFILALGMGVANIRSDKKAEADSFGLVALCSIGPILSVLLLGFFYGSNEGDAANAVAAYSNTVELGHSYLSAIPGYMLETVKALSPILAVLLLFQIFSFHLKRASLGRILFGLFMTYIGLVLFLTGVNVGFSALGAALGEALASGSLRFLLIPLAMLLGFFIISAEPAVYVLEAQIDKVSAGAIPSKAIRLGLSVAISLAMGLSMLRVLTGLSLLWFLIPGYLIALLLSFFVPDIFTAIAFDAGGVATGPLTATFMLQFFMGTSRALGGNVLTDAFGVVAMVAMLPLITIQVIGVAYDRKPAPAPASTYGEVEIIELWEAAV